MNTSVPTVPEKIERINNVIRLPFPQETYEAITMSSSEFRDHLDKFIETCPELFPPQIHSGYRLKDMNTSKKLGIPIRRIKVGQTTYTIHPSFVMPFLSGTVDQVESALFLRKFNVPFWALAYVFGRDAMYWYRMEQTIGRMSVVGTTVRNPQDIPQHLNADEKHTHLKGQKAYVATTVGGGCFLGASISVSAGFEALKKAYGVFKQEALDLKAHYAPKTTNIDAWEWTKAAWFALFPSTCLILCFLHVFIKIRSCSKKKYKELFQQTADRLWNAYNALNKRTFSQRVRRLSEWAAKIELPQTMQKPIQTLRENLKAYSVAYDHPDAHRTSNMIDRLMQRMDRHLFAMQSFHRSIDAAQRGIRAWILIYNFAPWNPSTIKQHGGYQSPAHRLNKFAYHEHWLQNLLISASLGGFRNPPHKTL